MSTKSPTPVDATPRAEPQSFRARTITPSFTVNNLEKSLAWYQRILRFTIEEKWEHEGKVVGASLKAGEVEIMLNQDDGAKGFERIKGVGCSVHITTAQDVDELASWIKKEGIKLAAEPADMPWGARLFRVLDPDGFALTISSLS